MPVARKKFWSEGIRFECQGTGRCCTSRGGYGFVYLTEADEVRLAGELGLSHADFLRRHCEMTDGYVHLKNPDRDCEFLKDKRCGVYEGRPEQCRTWPFWPENMNARAWKRDVVSFCPGIGKGRLHSAQEIKALMARDPIDE